MNVRELNLDRLREKISLQLDMNIINVQARENPMNRTIEIEIEREFLGRRIIEDKEVTLHVSYPKNWFEHFKEEKFPNWLKKRFPVKYKTVKETKTVRF